MQLARKHTINNTAQGKAAQVYYEAQWEEWIVKFYAAGEHLAAADYHTWDEEDALSTAFTYCGVTGDPVIQ